MSDKNATPQPGKVYLVGAGPGDPELITVKGLKLLRQADVIVYDRLIPMELLSEARPDAELINAGKLPQKHRLDQAEINAILIERGQKNLIVVRLKGGDPFVFGRGGEEGIACYGAGIPFEVVPGVTSAIAVPAYAGVPMTHRHLATAFTVFTGHEDPTKAQSTVDYDALVSVAKVSTLVLLMGVAHLPEIVAKLIKAGLSPDTPAICIERGTIKQQRVVEATLKVLVHNVAEAKIGNPAITVIGSVVGLRQQGLDWFR